MVAMILPFSAMNFADAAPNENTNDKAKENNKTIDEETCFDLITESISEKESNLNIDDLKQKTRGNSEFNQMAATDKRVDFKNTIQYWKSDPVECTVELKQIDVKFNLDKDTSNHMELVTSIDTKSGEVIKTEMQEPYNVSHTNYNSDSANWVTINQMDGSTESSSDITKVKSYFDVPYPSDPSQLDCSSGTNKCIVSSWAGLSEDDFGSDTMIQSGTDSVCEGNNCASGRSYNAWLEKVDDDGSGDNDQCTSLTVNNGDSVRTWTYYYDSTNKYATSVYNYDEHALCSTTYYNETEDSHHGIFAVERPLDVSSGDIYRLPSFADFDMEGIIYVSGVSYGIGEYNTLGDTNKWTMKNSGTSNVVPSWPNTTTDKITFDYQSSAGTS